MGGGLTLRGPIDQSIPGDPWAFGFRVLQGLDDGLLCEAVVADGAGRN